MIEGVKPFDPEATFGKHYIGKPRPMPTRSGGKSKGFLVRAKYFDDFETYSKEHTGDLFFFRKDATGRILEAYKAFSRGGGEYSVFPVTPKSFESHVKELEGDSDRYVMIDGKRRQVYPPPEKPKTRLERRMRNVFDSDGFLEGDIGESFRD